jgi:hypothetical protein
MLWLNQQLGTSTKIVNHVQIYLVAVDSSWVQANKLQIFNGSQTVAGY